MKTPSRKKAVTGVVALLITAACLAAFIIPSQAVASGPADAWQGRAMDRQAQHRSVLGLWRNPYMIQKLELTEEQVKQLRDADFNARAKKLELKGQLNSVRLQMEKTMAADTLDDKTIVKMAKKIASLKGQLFVHQIESDLAVGNILSADQVAALKLFSGHPKKQSPRVGGRYLPSSYAVEKQDPKSSATF